MELEERAGPTPTLPWCGLGPGCRERVTQGRVTHSPRRLFREPWSCKAGQPHPQLGLGQDSQYLELAALKRAQVNLAGLLCGPGSALLKQKSVLKETWKLLSRDGDPPCLALGESGAVELLPYGSEQSEMSVWT